MVELLTVRPHFMSNNYHEIRRCSADSDSWDALVNPVPTDC